MASLPFPVSKSYSFSTKVRILDRSYDCSKDEKSIFENVKYSTRRKSVYSNNTIMNVATKPQPTVVPLSPGKLVPNDSKLAAWSSIRQERWQGELIVQGEIPLWLVCVSFCVYTQ